MIMIQDFVILLDLTNDSGQNEVFSVKIEARVLDLFLDETFGSKLSKASF